MTSTDKRDLFMTVRVRDDADINGRAGQFARIIARVGDCYTLQFADGEREGMVTEAYLERFCL